MLWGVPTISFYYIEVNREECYIRKKNLAHYSTTKNPSHHHTQQPTNENDHSNVSLEIRNALTRQRNADKRRTTTRYKRIVVKNNI